MKRTPLVRKTPLARKSPKPRQTHPERTAHLSRTKRTATSTSALEKKHLDRVGTLPCAVSGKRPVDKHHLMVAPGKERRRDHRWVVPLHPSLHNQGAESVHMLGSEAKFEAHHGLRRGWLIEQAAKLWEESLSVF
jgi:hypothetical protein